MFFTYKDGKTFLDIKVTTKASKNEIRGVKNDELSIYVTAVPENNKANLAIVELISKKTGISKSSIQIISGQKARNKKICIDAESEDLTNYLSQIPILKS